MADKYSHKPAKKKKSQARRNAPAQTMQYNPISPAPVTATPSPAPESAPAVRPDRQTAVAPDLTAELKRVGILGGILLLVLVAVSFIFG